MLLPAGFILAGNHIFRIFDGLVRVAPHQIGAAHHITIRMDEGRITAQCIEGICHSGQFGVIHLYQRSDLVELFFLICGNDGQHIPHITGNIALAHHHIPVLLNMSDLVAGNIRLCQHPHTVRVCLRAADVDAIDTGAGIAGVDAAGIEHSVHRNVIGEYTAAVDLFCRVNALACSSMCSVFGAGGIGFSRGKTLPPLRSHPQFFCNRCSGRDCP